MAEMMQAVICEGFGGPEVMQIGQLPVLVPRDNQILVRVHAAGINRADIMQRQGKYPPPPGACETLGLEIAGEIVAVAENANKWRCGQQICALAPGGGYAQYCLVSQEHALPIPDGLSMLEAASLPESLFTVWANVFAMAKLAQGENFLVHGGSSGIGVAAIQMAHLLGARVFTTAGSDEKCELCCQLGAEKAINYHHEDFVECIKRETGKKGVDVILDMVGGDYITRNIRLLARQGRLVNIAYMKGAKAEIDCMPVLLKRLTIMGSTLRARSDAQKGEIAMALQENIWPLLEGKKMIPVIDSTYPLAEVKQAHCLMESSRHKGKIMLAL